MRIESQPPRVEDVDGPASFGVRPIVRARLDKADGAIPVFAQPGREHAAGRAAAEDEHVEPFHARTLLPVEPAPGLVGRAQSHDALVAGELVRPPTAVPDPGPQRPGEQRLPPPEAAAPTLAVPAPELDVVADARHGAPPEPTQCDPERRIEPDDLVRRVEHQS